MGRQGRSPRLRQAGLLANRDLVSFFATEEDGFFYWTSHLFFCRERAFPPAEQYVH